MKTLSYFFVLLAIILMQLQVPSEISYKEVLAVAGGVITFLLSVSLMLFWQRIRKIERDASVASAATVKSEQDLQDIRVDLAGIRSDIRATLLELRLDLSQKYVLKGECKMFERTEREKDEQFP